MSINGGSKYNFYERNFFLWEYIKKQEQEEEFTRKMLFLDEILIFFKEKSNKIIA